MKKYILCSLIIVSVFFVTYNFYCIITDFENMSILNLIGNAIVSIYIVVSIIYILKNKTNIK
ncbi:hypothetical protein CYV15_02860 [Riemerella anatipestifer]|nr:hypothetical protein Riean_1280 [Riemerella anatipestifer ATCC 11845 = DSM 15868]AKQ39834.1 hypothetical protein AS87_05790 [Riemerella anatipestifer Yb2]MDD1524598.1 hypothetical protein [Riemerella anatipestifer]MDD1549631.1 hypothetical protein [Riemerella anatipestifer]MDD1551204.1 hypothetical protein [Riemerella anatipestifer]